MSRAAVYDAILADPDLQALGFDRSSVLVNYDGDQRPTDTMFMVLSWGNEGAGIQGDDVFSIPTKVLNIWVHMYKNFSTDFVRIDSVMDILDATLGGMINVDGADGYTLSQAIPNTRSRDLRDDSYQTLCRSTSYKIIDNVTTATV
jgi:hypothetical protein